MDIDQEMYEEEDDLEFLPEIKYRVKDNINLYYEDKTLIKDKEVLEILDKAYEWLYELLTDDLNNLKTFKPKYNGFYDIIYGYSKDNILVGYDKKNGVNKIHYGNFYLKFKSYMSDCITDCKILISIIHGYLVNTLQMKGIHTFHLRDYHPLRLVNTLLKMTESHTNGRDSHQIFE